MHRTALRLVLILLLAACCAASGCVRRTLEIQSDPPGATVWINGDNIGTTPAKVPFDSYGHIEVLLRLENHQVRREEVRLRAPWYAVFPIDFVTDVLLPVDFHDRKMFGFKLEPLEETDTDALKARAQAFMTTAKERLAREREKRGIELPKPPEKTD